MDSILADLARRIRRLEESSLQLRRGEISALSPTKAKLGGSDEEVPIPTLGSHAIGSKIMALAAGHSVLGLAGFKVRAVDVSAATGNPQTTSTADPMTQTIPGMSIAADFGGNPLMIFYGGTFYQPAGSGTIAIRTALYDGSTEIATLGDSRRQISAATNAARQVIDATYFYTPPAGSRTISYRWNVSSGTAQNDSKQRHLIIVELRGAGTAS